MGRGGGGSFNHLPVARTIQLDSHCLRKPGGGFSEVVFMIEVNYKRD